MEQTQNKQENVVLCGANSYEQKYYFNPQFEKLPTQVKEQIQAIAVLFTEEVGGILTMEFEQDGTLIFKTMADEYDYLYDEISCGLKIHQIQKVHRDLLESLETFYRIFLMGEAVSEELLKVMEEQEQQDASEKKGTEENQEQEC